MIPTARKRKLAAAIKRTGAEALLVTSLPDIRYLTGFTGSNAALFVQGSRITFFTDGRYTTQAATEIEAGGSGAKIIIAEHPITAAAIQFLLQHGDARGIATCAFDTATTTVANLEAMRAALPARLRKRWFVPTSGLIADLRTIKDEDEQDKMRAAAALGCRLFDQVLEYVVPGATEMEVAMALEYMARLEGAERMSFESIIVGGERGALPHGHASTAKLPRRGFVVMDFGVVLEGYCSDMTRTVHLGPARRGAKGEIGEREAYDAVLEAQEAGVRAVRAGALSTDVDEAARSILRAAGLADYFTHSLGHGVGIQIHEAPTLARQREGVTPTALKAGMIVTIEPGIYLPGKFGIRIEDTVLVTDEGCEILTPSTKAWIEL